MHSVREDLVEERGELDDDGLDGLPAAGGLPSTCLSNMGPMSFSADNLPLLLENSDVGLSSRWRLLGLNTAGCVCACVLILVCVSVYLYVLMMY